MSVFTLGAKRPVLPAEGEYYIAPGAQVIGDVHLGSGASIWFNAVLRADNEPIRLGPGSNIQDNCICHVDPGFPMTIGRDVTVGHGAILHGCSIGDETLIGMGAIVLNGAKIGKGCVIGAKALVTEGTEIPDYSMVLGMPGKIVKTLDPEMSKKFNTGAAVYQEKIRIYSDGLTEI